MKKFFTRRYRDREEICSKIKKKRLGMTSYVEFVFKFIRSLTVGLNESPKYGELSSPPNAVKLKLKEVNLGNSILKMTSFMTPKK